MIKKILQGLTLSAVLFTAFMGSVSMAKDSKGDAAVLSTLKAKLKSTFKSEPDSIKESVVPGMYEVIYGTEVVYLSSDGKYFLSGNLIDMQTRENVSDRAKQSIRQTILTRKDNKPVTFKAKNEKHKLTVFTDVDCPYCAKLHREVPALNEKGITVEYLMFPRAGLQSASFTKAVSMWCADDNMQSMTDAKERKPIADKSCDSPIKDQYLLGQELGVTGVPALITSTGKLIPGYMPADRLAAMLEAETKKK